MYLGYSELNPLRQGTKVGTDHATCTLTRFEPPTGAPKRFAAQCLVTLATRSPPHDHRNQPGPGTRDLLSRPGYADRRYHTE